jgi:hypothetical protein
MAPFGGPGTSSEVSFPRIVALQSGSSTGDQSASVMALVVRNLVPLPAVAALAVVGLLRELRSPAQAEVSA